MLVKMKNGEFKNLEPNIANHCIKNKTAKKATVKELAEAKEEAKAEAKPKANKSK